MFINTSSEERSEKISIFGLLFSIFLIVLIIVILIDELRLGVLLAEHVLLVMASHDLRLLLTPLTDVLLDEVEYRRRLLCLRFI